MPEAFNLDADAAHLEDQNATRREGEHLPQRTASMQLHQPKLTKLEQRVMEAVWSCGKASIREILEVFPTPRPAYTTIQTIVYRLEMKNAVRRVRKVGNAHIFEPVLRQDAPQGGVGWEPADEFLSAFASRPQAVMARLVESGMLTLDYVRELERQIEAHERKHGANGASIAVTNGSVHS